MGQFKNALVIGAGAFGTSIASILCENFQNVYLKVRDKDLRDAINKGENQKYLPGHSLPKNLFAVLDWNEVDSKLPATEIDLIVSGLPTAAIFSFFNENMKRFQNYFSNGVPMVSLAKGIDPDTLELPDDLFAHFFSEHSELITFLSGPSFAKEILEKQVTVVSLAGRSPEILLNVSTMLQTDYFKAFPTYDIKGVLLGGALKNILAIASGILEGLGYNHNTRAAMITRGITEMLRFGKVFNARAETFYSYAGMGDLILTTTGELSRNKQFGIQIALGKTADQILSESVYVVEGYKTTLAAHRLAEKYQIRPVLFNAIYEILFENACAKEAITKMMAMPVNTID